MSPLRPFSCVDFAARIFLYEMLQSGPWPAMATLEPRRGTYDSYVVSDPASGISVRTSVDGADVDFEILVGDRLVGVRAYNMDVTGSVKSITDFSERCIVPAVIAMRTKLGLTYEP